ncbi:MAG: hypothetical protein GQ569_05830 [Methylococcaceae bacterium]|nr:hypothetical protein [Methylococcaceae bacterium]
MNNSFNQDIQNELNHREVMKWSGRPKPRAFAASSLIIFLFAIPWTAFSIFWIFAASGFQVPDFDEGFDFFPLFGLPFLFIGIGMLLSPIFMYSKAKKTVYVITNQRAFQLYCGKRKKVKSYAPEEIGHIERIEEQDGSGNLYFATEQYATKRGTREVKVGFLGISDVKMAETRLVTLKGLTNE